MPASVNLLVATAGNLQKDLSSGHLTSVELVNACLELIEQHNDYFHAIISKPPRPKFVWKVQILDIERERKAMSGKLHGTPGATLGLSFSATVFPLYIGQ